MSTPVKFIIGILSIFYLGHFTGNAQVDVLADDGYTFVKDGAEVTLPYYATHSLDQLNEEVSHIIVVVHGTNRNADDYFSNMKNALNQRPNEVRQTLIIAPQFLREDDIDAFNPGENYAYWSSDGWKVGSTSKNESSNPRDIRISSYEVLDSLILHLARTFTEVESLVFTGHSAGGQLTNRYTASSPIFSILCEDFGVSSKSIIANPGSYVYFSPRRPIPGTMDQFEIPQGCAEYDDYSYGLNDLYIYHDRVGADQMKEWYGSREIVYLFGALDNDPNASTLPSSCRAQLQGSNRLEKGMIYFNHMLDTYGADIEQTQKMMIVPDVGHNNFNIYNSDEGLKVLFDEGTMKNCQQTTSTFESSNGKIFIYPNPNEGSLIVSTAGFKDEKRKIIIYDLLGQKVLQHDLIGSSSKLDISHINPGQYFVELSSSSLKELHKLIKM